MVANCSEEFYKAVSKTKIDLMTTNNSIFFSTVGFRLNIVCTEDVPTMGVDGTNIHINPDFFLELTKKERLGVYVHEIMHVVYMHMFISKEFNLDKLRHNVACDYYINNELISKSFTLPNDALIDASYKGMSSMEIYNALENKINESKGISKYGGDILGPGEDMSQEEIDSLKEHIEEIVITGVIKAQAENEAGSVPGEILKKVDKLINPTLPWNIILSNYVNSTSKEDYSYKRFNKRFFPKHYLPSLYSEHAGDIAIAIDTSGSITSKEFDVFISEIQSIKETIHPHKLTSLCFDTKIASKTTLYEGDSVDQLELKGGGGTNIQPVLNWVVKNNPEFIIIFTDGYFNKYIPEGIESDIIWIIKGNPTWKYDIGKIIYYDK